MPSRIAIYCCNNLFSEGIKRLLEEDGMGINYRITISNQEEALNAKPDILITDFHTLSMLSHNPILNHKTAILLLWTGCLPKLEDEHLLEFISQGLVGILLPEETTFPNLKKAIERIASGELWFTRKKLNDIIFYTKQARVEVSQLIKREIEIVTLVCNGYRNKVDLYSIASSLLPKQLQLAIHSVLVCFGWGEHPLQRQRYREIVCNR